MEYIAEVDLNGCEAPCTSRGRVLVRSNVRIILDPHARCAVKASKAYTCKR